MFHPSFIGWSFGWMTTTVADPMADQQSTRISKARGAEAMMCLVFRCLVFYYFDQGEVNG
jgi:hypothetical protein